MLNYEEKKKTKIVCDSSLFMLNSIDPTNPKKFFMNELSLKLMENCFKMSNPKVYLTVLSTKLQYLIPI